MSATNEANETVGRYALSRRLATGGMAEVWLARELGSAPERRVVLKMLLPELGEDPDFVKMFLDEARLASSLDHPNVVRVFDLGRLENHYFIAMEYVAGKTLRQVLHRLRRDNRRLPVWFALLVAVKTCEALEHAHGACDDEGWPLNIVHRDVTPENVMVAYDGSIKVLDFGIAKASTRSARTRAGVMKGKHAYLAPEQILSVDTGCPVDHRADLYSLGVILYELVTATRPFEADNELGLIHSIVHADSKPQPPRTLAPWLEKEVEAVILRAMARDPSERFESAAAMRAALAECLSTGGQHPTERHVGGMLSLIFPASEDSTRTPGSLADAPPQKAETSVVPESDVGHDGPYGASETAARAGVAPAEGIPQRHYSGVQACEAAFAAFAELSNEVTLPGGPSATGEADKHCWDLVLDKLQSERGTQPGLPSERAVAESTPSRLDRASATNGSSAPPTVDPRRQARLEFERGLEHHRHRHADAALQALERAVALDPENRLYRSNLRMLQRRAGLPEGEGQG